MCGRYAFSRVDKQLLERLGIKAEQIPAGLAPRFNIAPGQQAPAVQVRADGLQMTLQRWGFPKAEGGLLINARVETASTLPTFRDAWRHRRCALPAEGWFEWLKEGRQRRPHYIQAAGGRTVLLAGLWQPLPAGGAAHVILTCPAVPAIAHLHPRMPFVLPDEGWEAWLRGEGDASLTVWPEALLNCWEVAPRVNGVAVDDEELLAPVQSAQGRLFA